MRLLILIFGMAGTLGASSLLAQTPKLIIPGKGSSRDMATLQLPPSLAGLGSLRNDLTAWFSMDAVETGGLGWSRQALDIRAEGAVRVVEQGNRRYLDFSEAGAVLRFAKSYPTGDRFTFCAWVLFPLPVEYAVVWGGDKGDMLALEKSRVSSWDYRDKTGKTLAVSEQPFTGWHHLALTYDGRQMQGFFNGQPLAVIPGLTAVNMATIGNHRERTQYDMTAGVDEQFMFSRVLKPIEIQAVMKFSAVEGEAPAATTVTATEPAPSPSVPPKPSIPQDPNAPNPFGEQRNDPK